MANRKLTDLPELLTPADGDFIYIVDISDTTESAQGSSKKIKNQNLKISSDQVLNASNVPGATTTEALDNLNDLKEDKVNKQDSLAVDGTGTKFPTVDAVNYLKNDLVHKFIYSNEDISLASRDNDTLYGILDQYTGEDVTLQKIDFTPYTVDNVIYYQLGSEYFKRVFSNGVKISWYGAVADDNSIDNHDAIMDAIDYVYSLGNDSEEIVIPRGEFFTSYIDIPYFDYTLYPDLVLKPVIFRGEGMPSQLFGTVGSFALGNSGSILTCLSTTAGKAVLRSDAPSGEFSFISLQVYELEIRTYDNPIISGIDGFNAEHMIIDNVQVTTGVYSVDASEPTTVTSYAVRTPKINNGALTYFGNFSASGYYNGIEVNEHTEGLYLNIFCCKNGMVFKKAFHTSYFTRVDLCRNTNNVVFQEGLSYVKIDVLNTEHTGVSQTTPGNIWQTNIYDISDVNNYGRGYINWHTVMGGDTTPSYIFNVLGADGIAISSLSRGNFSTPAGYYEGGYVFQRNTIDSGSRMWDMRTDIGTYGAWALRRETGSNTNTFANVIIADRTGQISFVGISPIVPDATLGTQAINMNQLLLAGSLIPTYSDNATAVLGGLTVNKLYKTPTGEIRVVV